VKLPLEVILKMQPLVWRLSIPWQVDKVNASLCDMLGYNTEEMIEKNFSRNNHPDDLALDYI
jgi:PAS domain-containing protein